ncbi:MAG: nickel pincer cofactor biosynthesis protein LarB [Candidatus Freyarchaeota archaeon]|nr:nickel pincer cofactor biosynthesis protein LarB [Candidatus Freyrarchaeum guaymaensis]
MELKEIAKIDVGREHRSSVPEIVYATGKRLMDLLEIARKVVEEKGYVVVTRCDRESLDALIKEFSAEKYRRKVIEEVGTIYVQRDDYKPPRTGGKVGVLTAGTADIPVAEEAKLVAECMGCEVYTAYDVGVAGIHRLFEPLAQFVKSGVDVIVVVAGMEGALPSVVAGLVDLPVIGVPTSTGYGLGGGGIGALISMLQSCSPGLAVVNIDNGLGGGAMAAIIANRIAMFREGRRHAEDR